MSDFIGNIFYFGSPKDGFKVYPNLGAASSVFNGYYSNTETDWILIANKLGAVTRYTFVRYGLLTSTIAGRTGSCFGISIDLLNCYFTDLTIFRQEIIEEIWGVILKHKKLLTIQETSGKVAFESYDLFDVSQYLDEMSKKIKEVISDKKYAEFIRPSHEVANASNDFIHELHPHSSVSVVNEYFKTYGAIKLSPKAPIETKTTKEKEEEYKRNLQTEVEKLTDLLKQNEIASSQQLKQKDVDYAEQLKQKNIEIQRLHQILERTRNLVAALSKEFSDFEVKQDPESVSTNSKFPIYTYEPNTDSSRIIRSDYKETKQKSGWMPNLSQKNVIVAIISVSSVVLFPIIIYWTATHLFLNDKPEQQTSSNNNQPINQTITQRKAEPEIVVPLVIKETEGRFKGYLIAPTFLEKNRDKEVTDEKIFEDILTSYLLKYSPEVKEVYKDDKDEVWNNIMKLNPNSQKKIADFLERNKPLKIGNNQEQQNLLKDLLIYQK